MINISPIVFALIAGTILGSLIFLHSLLKLWVRAFASGVPIHFVRIVGMKLRGNPAQLLIDAYVLLYKEGVGVSLDEMEYLYMQNRYRIRLPEELVRLVKEKKK